MDILQPNTYLIGLIGILSIFAILAGRQLLKVRNDEAKLIRLEKKGTSNSTEASQLYELASVQLRKRLYPQATATLKKAIKQLENEPEEAAAIIENALGFSLAAQDNFETAVIHYQKAIKAKADYPVALNNLGFANERLLKRKEAFDIYQKVLEIDPKNKTAARALKKLESNNNNNELPNANDNRGF